MSAVVPPVVAMLGLALYFGAVAAGVPTYRRVPWEILAIVGAGAVASVVLLAATPSAGRAVAAVGAVGLFGFAVWFFFGLTMYRAREDRPAVGERFPDFTLLDSAGRPFALAEARGRRHLVMLYRGYW